MNTEKWIELNGYYDGTVRLINVYKIDSVYTCEDTDKTVVVVNGEKHYVIETYDCIKEKIAPELKKDDYMVAISMKEG